MSIVVCSFFEFRMVSKWCIREWVNSQFRIFTNLEETTFENIEGIGENAGNQHFLLFPTMFFFHPMTDENRYLSNVEDDVFNYFEFR